MKDRDVLLHKVENNMLMTSEELEELARTSGKVKWLNRTPKHVSVKSLTNEGVIFPADGEIGRQQLREIWKAFKRCGFIALLLGAAYLLHSMGVF